MKSKEMFLKLEHRIIRAFLQDLIFASMLNDNDRAMGKKKNKKLFFSLLPLSFFYMQEIITFITENIT